MSELDALTTDELDELNRYAWANNPEVAIVDDSLAEQQDAPHGQNHPDEIDGPDDGEDA